MQYIPGLLFLTFMSVVITLPWALLVQNRRHATMLAAFTSIVILKTWAYLAIGAFDLWFLLILAAISLPVSALTIRFTPPIRRSRHVNL